MLDWVAEGARTFLAEQRFFLTFHPVYGMSNFRICEAVDNYLDYVLTQLGYVCVRKVSAHALTLKTVLFQIPAHYRDRF